MGRAPPAQRAGRRVPGCDHRSSAPEGSDKLVASDHTRLQGEQSEQEVAFCVVSSCHRCSSQAVDGGDVRGWQVARPGRCDVSGQSS